MGQKEISVRRGRKMEFELGFGGEGRRSELARAQVNWWVW